MPYYWHQMGKGDDDLCFCFEDFLGFPECHSILPALKYNP